MSTRSVSSNPLITGTERFFGTGEVIVSKTDTRGVMGYVNKVFLDISGFTEDEVIGKPHSLIRHPHMPHCVFGLLWETIKDGREIFAYVKNRCKNGDHYWVLAHVTPCFGPDNKVIGYHSNRRTPRPDAIKTIDPVYRKLAELEEQTGPAGGWQASRSMLNDFLQQKGVSYDKFILSI